MLTKINIKILKKYSIYFIELESDPYLVKIKTRNIFTPHLVISLPFVDKTEYLFEGIRCTDNIDIHKCNFYDYIQIGLFLCVNGLTIRETDIFESKICGVYTLDGSNKKKYLLN